MVVGGYCLHLYCDEPGCKHGEFKLRAKFVEISGQTRSGTISQARKLGWRVDWFGNRATCPGHRKENA